MQFINIYDCSYLYYISLPLSRGFYAFHLFLNITYLHVLEAIEQQNLILPFPTDVVKMFLLRDAK